MLCRSLIFLPLSLLLLPLSCHQEQCIPGDPSCNPIPQLVFGQLALQCSYEGSIQALGAVEFQSGIGPTVVFDARVSQYDDSIILAGYQDSGPARSWVVAETDFDVNSISVLDMFNPGSGAAAVEMEFHNGGLAVVGSGDPGSDTTGFLRFSEDLNSWSTLDQFQYSGETTLYSGVASQGESLFITGNITDGTNSRLLTFLRIFTSTGSNVFLDNSGSSPGGPYFSPIRSNGLADFTVEYESVDGSTPATIQVSQIDEDFSLEGNTYSFTPFSNPQKNAPVDFAVTGNDFFVPAYGPSSVSLMKYSLGAWSPADTVVEPSKLGAGVQATRTGPVVWALGAGSATSDLQLRIHVLRNGAVRRLNVPTHLTDNTTNQPQTMVELPNGDLIIFATSYTTTQALNQTMAYRIPCIN